MKAGKKINFKACEIQLLDTFFFPIESFSVLSSSTWTMCRGHWNFDHQWKHRWTAVGTCANVGNIFTGNESKVQSNSALNPFQIQTRHVQLFKPVLPGDSWPLQGHYLPQEWHQAHVDCLQVFLQHFALRTILLLPFYKLSHFPNSNNSFVCSFHSADT